jgi:DNA-binding SARP family transcriptional activator
VSVLSLALRGSPIIQHAGRLVVFPTRKTLALLAYLAVERGAHSREKIAALLWPESDAGQARTTLRSTLALLRTALGEPGAHLTATREALAFDRMSEHVLDTDALRAAARAAIVSVQPNQADPLLRQLTDAATAWRGDFLDGFSLGDAPEFDDWATLQRESLHRAAALVCDTLSRLRLDRGELDSALEIAGLWVARDRLSESAHRRLIQIHAAAGDRSAALKAYAICRAVLLAELGVEPEPATEAVAARVRAGTSIRVLDAPAAHAPGASSLLPAAVQSTAFVGRAAQQLALATAYRVAAQGATAAVAVLGEPGIGKTRLVSEFLTWAVVHGADVLRGRAHETGGRLSYHPLIEALRRRLEAIPDLRSLLAPTWLAELARLLPELLDRVEHLPLPAHVAEAEAHARLFEAVARLGHALATHAPLVLFVDDLQWADAASLDLLAYLARRWVALGTRALIILTARSEELEGAIAAEADARVSLADWLAELGRTISLSELRLAPLTREDTGQLVRALIAEDRSLEQAGAPSGHWSVIEALRTWLYEATGGQPFFMVQTLGALLESRALRQAEAGGWELSPPARGELLPTGIRDLVLARLRRLSVPAHLACTACAVLGEGCDFEQVREVSGLQAPEDLAAIEELLRRGLLNEHAGSYSFAHDTIREVAYTEVSETRRRLFHRRALTSLEQTDAPAARLAYHALASGLPEAALRHSLAAGDEAMGMSAVRAAVSHYEQARALYVEQEHTLPRARASGAAEGERHPHRALAPRIFLGLGRAYEFISAWEQARSVYRELLQWAHTYQDNHAEADALSRLATVEAQGFFDLAQAQALLGQARARAERSGDAGRLAEIAWNLAQITFYCWELERSLAHGMHALDLALGLGAQELEARSRNIVAYNLMMIGRWDEAIVQADRARALFTALGNRALEADCLSIVAIIQVNTGRVAEGIAAARAGVAIGQEVENPWGLANCAHPLTRGLLDQGEWGEALEVARAGVAAARTAGHPPTLVFNLLALGAVYRAHAALEAAYAAHREAQAIGEAMRHPLLREWSAIELCADAAQAEAWAEAATFAQEALTLRRPDRVYVGCARWLETEALVRAGLRDSAAADLEQTARTTPMYPRMQLQLDRGRAVLAATAGNLATAITHLEAAGVLAEQLGLRYDRWQIDLALAAIYGALGSPAAAECQVQATAAATAFAARVTDPELQARLLAG